MLQEFDGAARILNLEPGIWKILTHPKRQIVVSCPVQMDNGEIEVFTGYRVQYNITLGPAKGGIRYQPGRLARRGDPPLSPRGMTWKCGRRAHPVRRRQGRRHLRNPTKMSRREVEALTAPGTSAEIIDRPSARKRTSRRPTSTPTSR